jgi:hypothetical protein
MGNGIFGHSVLQGTGGIGLGLVDTKSITDPKALAVTQAYNAAWQALMAKGMTDAQANTALKNSKTDPTYAIWSLTLHPSFPLTANQQAAVAYATQNSGGTKDSGSSVTLPGAKKSNTGLIVGGVLAVAAVGGFVAWKKGLFGKKAAA